VDFHLYYPPLSIKYFLAGFLTFFSLRPHTRLIFFIACRAGTHFGPRWLWFDPRSCAICSGDSSSGTCEGFDDGVYHSESLDFCTLTFVRNSKYSKTTFQKLDLFPSSGEVKETHTLLDSLGRAKFLRH
jgi:hypothetical protein